MMSLRRTVLAGLAILIGGCPERFEPATSVGFGSQASLDGAGSNDDCTPGKEGCPCVEGDCDDSLTCASELCVDLGDNGGTTGAASQTGPDPGDDDSSNAESTGDGVMTGACTSNGSCAADQVCSPSTGDCVAAYGHTYDVTMTWQGNASACYDEPADCTPDPFFYVYFSGVQSWSEVAPNAVAANTTPLELTITSTDTLAVIVFDENEDGSQTLINGCFEAPPGCPGVIPQDFLHGGALQWGEPPEYLRVDFLPH